MTESEMADIMERVDVNRVLHCVLHWDTDLDKWSQVKGYSEIELAQKVATAVRDVMSFGRRVLSVATPVTELSYDWCSGPTGIYFLVKGDAIVYVGQSKYIQTRVSSHYIEGVKDFDRVAFIEVAADLLDSVETRFIETFNPKLNVIGRPKIDLRAAIAYMEKTAGLPGWLTGDALIHPKHIHVTQKERAASLPPSSNKPTATSAYQPNPTKGTHISSRLTGEQPLTWSKL